MPTTRSKGKREAATTASSKEPKRSRKVAIIKDKTVEEKESKASDEEDLVNRTTFEKLLAVGREFVVQGFQNINQGKKTNYDEKVCERVWNKLEGTPWQQDAEVALAALKSYLDSLKLKESKLLFDKNFVKKALFAVSNKEEAKKFWELISADVQTDPNVALASLRRGVVTFRGLPDKIQKDEKLLREGLQQGRFKLISLPLSYQKNVEFALDARAGNVAPPFSKVLKKVTDKDRLWREWGCVHLRDPDRSDWEQIPASVTSDAEFMRKTISIGPSISKYLHSSLAENLQFIESVLQKNIISLSSFPASTYLKHPTILNLQSIAKFAKDKRAAEWNCGILRKIVPSKYWQDVGFVVGWVSNEIYLPRNLPKEICDTDDVFLAFAKVQTDSGCHRQNQGGVIPYSLMSERLRGNKVFIRQLLEFGRPSDIMRFVPETIIGDEQLQVFASAKHPHYRFFNVYFGNEKTNTLLSKLKKQKQEYNKFFCGILCGSAVGSGSPLVMLNQGSDTSIKRHIASFLDFPTGSNLGYLLKAVEHHARHP